MPCPTIGVPTVVSLIWCTDIMYADVVMSFIVSNSLEEDTWVSKNRSLTKLHKGIYNS